MMHAYIQNNNNIHIFNNFFDVNSQTSPKFLENEVQPLPFVKLETPSDSNSKPEYIDSKQNFTSMPNSDFEIKCLNFEAKCKWKGSIMELFSHISKECPGRERKPFNRKKDISKEQLQKKKEKMVKCLFFENGCHKLLYKKAYADHLIKEHSEEIFCSVKKFDLIKEEKDFAEKKFKRLLKSVLWADFYQKKAIEKLNNENSLLRKKLTEIEGKEKKVSFKPFLSNNSETVAGHRCWQCGKCDCYFIEDCKSKKEKSEVKKTILEDNEN